MTPKRTASFLTIDRGNASDLADLMLQNDPTSFRSMLSPFLAFSVPIVTVDPSWLSRPTRKS